MHLVKLTALIFIVILELFMLPTALSALYSYVTCGSVLKLLNDRMRVRLHSHEVKYGSGSGQQSVTAIDDEDDVNSHWLIKGKSGNPCKRGEPVSCGSTVRFEHLPTRKNLHSHHFSSPLSNNQEISCFGTNGEGDTGDNWIVTCSSSYWERSGLVRLKHADTDMWMGVSGNTYSRPISGQKEVCALPYSDSNCYWKAAEGVFIKPTENAAASTSHQHTEL